MRRTFLRVVVVFALILVSIGVECTTFNPTIVHATGGSGPNSIVAPTLPTSSAINLASCPGSITQSGNYVLTQDLVQPANSSSACISFDNANGISLDCQGYSIQPGSGSPSPMAIYNTSNFSIKNCNLPKSTLNLNSASKGVVDNVTMSSTQGQGGTFHVSNSNNISITNSVLTYSPYYQTASSYINFSNNKVSADPTIRSADLSGTVELDGGSNNNVESNDVEGNWNSGLAYGLASDDGIMLQGRSGDYIYNNTIHNVWDTGIETIGQITGSQILNNTITNAQNYGIGGWYQNSWLNNTVQSNTVSETTKMLEFFVDTSQFSNYSPQTFYFQGNQFSGNQFVSGTAASPSSEATVLNYNSAYLPAGVTPTIGSNVFQNNYFGVFSNGPHLDPASMVIDSGGNVCAPNHSYPSLACTTEASAPSEPSPPPASPVDTVTVGTDPVYYGTSTLLSWNATNSPTSCSGNFPGLTGSSGTYSATPTTTTTYYFNCSNATAGNTSWVTVNVVTPTLVISGPTASPLNSSSNYTASIAECTPAANGWTWNVGGGTGSSTTNAINVSWATTGSKTITVSNSACGTKTGTLNVTVNGDTLVSNQQLTGGGVLQSSDGQYTLAMQTDGNFVIYDTMNRALWNTGTSGHPGDAGARVVMQPDGNLVIYSSGNQALWNSGTAGNSGARLTMQTDGNLVIYDSHGRALWSWKTGRIYLTPYTTTDTLNSGQTMSSGSSLSATNWLSMIVMQTDGNLVVYDNYGRPLWYTGTTGNPGAYLAMQSDGNLVIYSSSNKALWDSATADSSGTHLTMQTDGNLVIYNTHGKALWSWKSGRLS